MASIFSKIIQREIPADIIYEDDVCLAFRDIDPKAPVHVLIIPKKEIRSLADATPADEKILGHLLAKSADIARKLNVDKNGYRIVINTNDDGGQTVFHIHLHLLAGRKLQWPPG
jgi:histidine triad (HIT) family protein